jgi:hypothetical protein
MVTVIIGSEHYEVRGRLAEMIAWLVKRAEQIRNGSTGVRFSYRGQALRAVIETEETIA